MDEDANKEVISSGVRAFPLSMVIGQEDQPRYCWVVSMARSVVLPFQGKRYGEVDHGERVARAFAAD